MNSQNTTQPQRPATHDNYCLMQWNCQGARGKKDELLDYIHNFKIDIIALQETKLDDKHHLKIPDFNVERYDGHINHGAHGGVATYIHNHLPYERIPIQTQIQAVAVRIQTSSFITICNIQQPRQRVPPLPKTKATAKRGVLYMPQQPCPFSTTFFLPFLGGFRSQIVSMAFLGP